MACRPAAAWSQPINWRFIGLSRVGRDY